MPKVVWTPDALADAQRLIAFLKDKNIIAAQRAAQHLKEAGDKLTHTPHLGRPMPDETERRELFTSFGKRGYVIRYRLDGETAVILRVWHALEGRTGKLH